MTSKITITTIVADENGVNHIVEEPLDITVHNAQARATDHTSNLSHKTLVSEANNLKSLVHAIVDDIIDSTIDKISAAWKQLHLHLGMPGFAEWLHNFFCTLFCRRYSLERVLLSLRSLRKNSCLYLIRWRSQTEYQLFWSETQSDSRLKPKGPYRVNSKRCVPKLT